MLSWELVARLLGWVTKMTVPLDPASRVAVLSWIWVGTANVSRVLTPICYTGGGKAERDAKVNRVKFLMVPSRQTSAWQLYQFPLCPFSRKVRLLLSEQGKAFDLVRENPWERRAEFLRMSPLSRTPALCSQSHAIILTDSRAICEYLLWSSR